MRTALRALLTLLALPALIVLLLLPSLRADDEGSKVYKKAVASCVWIHAKHEKGTATGSGTLIDADRRLALTNYHVVEDQARVNVFFPAFRDGQPIAERTYYTDRIKSLGIGAKVIARDKKADLAIVQLDSLPAGKVAISLAPASAEPGQSVHSIGNAGKSGALWGYVPGKVRQVYNKEWKADLDGKVLTFKAKVVETDSATNPGDSGGPLLNDKNELVGVTEGGAVNAQLISTFVDVSEVKKLLQTPEVKALPGAKPAVKPRDKPPVFMDNAKLFSDDARKKAQAIIDELHTKQKFDVLVETFPSAPKDELEKVRAMSREDRTKYMHDWVRKRMIAENSPGLGILISADPRSYFIEMPDTSKKLFPTDLQKNLIDMLADGLKNKKQDETLVAMLEKIRDSHGKK